MVQIQLNTDRYEHKKRNDVVSKEKNIKEKRKRRKAQPV